MRKSLIGLAGLLITSCAVSPLTPFPATHPASAQAPEAAILPFQNSLAAPDEATRKSRDLISREEPQKTAPMPGMN